jgi:hypothetical protein
MSFTKFEDGNYFKNMIKNNIISLSNINKIEINPELPMINIFGPNYSYYTPDSIYYDIVKILFYEFEYNGYLIIPNDDFKIPYYIYENNNNFKENKLYFYEFIDDMNNMNNKKNFFNMFYFDQTIENYDIFSDFTLFYNFGKYNKNSYLFFNDEDLLIQIEYLKPDYLNKNNVKFSNCLITTCQKILENIKNISDL